MNFYLSMEGLTDRRAEPGFAPQGFARIAAEAFFAGVSSFNDGSKELYRSGDSLRRPGI
jgi:hypothetical protein